MSTLERIYISGIRSFGIEKSDGQKFSFYSPLTLFLGQNGCGKTTIIEAIRYAITGDIPPGTNSGQGFISDPNMHHVPHVLGQIKLVIGDVRGNKATITRIMKCEKTYNSLKFSTLESMITYLNKNGVEETLSGRTGDLNNMAVQLMGVAPAIINNVLFCHQEQSLWPLEDGLQLKKKFDEIFDSVKYNKCVLALRGEIKSRNDELKVLVVKIESAQKGKEEVEEKTLRLQDRENKLEALVKEEKLLKEQLIPIDERLMEIGELENSLLELQSKKSSKENEKKNLTEMQTTLVKNLGEEYSGTDEELQEEIDSFHKSKETQTANLDGCCKQKVEVEKAENAELEVIQKKSARLVQTKGEIKAYKSKLTERDGLISKLSRSMNSDLLTIDTNEDASTAISVLAKLLQEENIKVNRMSDEFKAKNRELQSVIDESREKCVQSEQEVQHKEKDINDCKGQLREFKTKLKELDISDGMLKTYQKNIADINKDLETLSASFNEDLLTKSIEDDKKQIKVSEVELEALEQELKIWQRNSITDNEIENLKRDMLRKESDIDKMKNKYFNEFNELFPEFPQADLKNSVQNLIHANNRKVMEINNKITASQKSVTTLEIERKHLEKELKVSENELQQSKNKVSKLCGSSEYNKKCDDLQKVISELQRKKGQWSSAKILYEKFVDDINENKCCPVCSTDFNNKERVINEVVKSIKIKIADLPEQLQNITGELTQQEGLYKKLLQLAPINEKLRELTVNIPTLQEKINKTVADLDEMKDNLNDLKSEIKTPQKLLETSNKVVSTSALIDQNNKEIQKANEKISTLEIQLIKVDSSRSKQQTEAEIDNLKADLSSLRDGCEKNQKKLNMNNKRCQDLREKRNVIVQKQLDLQKNMQGKPQLLERVSEIEERIERLAAEIDATSDTLISLQTGLAEAKHNMETIRSKNESALELAKTQYHQHKTELNDINKIHASVIDIAAENLEIKFNNILQEITNHKCKKAELTDEKDSLIEKISKIKIEISNQELYFRNLKDNRSLREKRKLEKVVDAELSELKKKIGNHNYRSVLQEKNELNKKKAAKEQKIQINIGKKEEHVMTINETRMDLEKPVNKNAFIIYRDLCIESKVTEIGVTNLQTFVEALEKAIIVLHRTRMTQINKNIRQLWMQIYKGNDIDYIQIDNDVTHVGQKRSYKYRVMQKKNDTLLEMRGRCSAGQKVLASLIIRIALAETFSANCGILALDEPTTNLDRENIESLSISLAGIINSRQAQKNFQLLVITHDEEFLRTLRAVDSVRYYYKVMRNNKGCTVVSPERM